VNFKTISNILKRKKFHHLTITSSVLFLLFTAFKTHFGAPEASIYWYVSNLYWTFWPGLVLSILSIIFSIHCERKYLGLVSVLIPVFYLYALPSLVHDMLPVFDIYHVIPQVLSIAETSQWNMQMTPFPGSHIYQAVSVITFDMHIFSYARLFPTILAFSIVIFIYTMARRISKTWAPMAPMTFLALNWYMEYHLARQPFTIMLWTAFWLAFFLYFEKKNYRIGFITCLIFLALIPSHPGMIIITAFNLIGLTFVMFVSIKDKEEYNYISYFLPMLLIFGIIAILLFVSIPTIGEYMNEVYEDFSERLENGTLSLALGGPQATSLQYQFVNNLRMFAGALHSLLGLLGFIALYKYSSKKALLLGAWFFSIYLWFIYSFTQDGHMIERAFLSSIVPASILTTAFLKHFNNNNLKFLKYFHKIHLKRISRIAIILTVASLLILVPITKNSIDAIETPSRSSYTAGTHAQNNFEERVYVTDSHTGLFRYIESTEGDGYSTTYQFRSRGRTPRDQPYGYRIPDTTRTDLSPLIFTDYFNNYIEIRYGNTTYIQDIQLYEENISNDSAKIYHSGGSRIYVDV